jgi:hypothetical protein
MEKWSEDSEQKIIPLSRGYQKEIITEIELKEYVAGVGKLRRIM